MKANQDAHLRLVVALLELDAHPLKQGASLPLGVKAQYGSRTGIRPPGAQDALDSRALSRSVGAQQPKHRAAPDGEVQPTQYRSALIALGESFHLHCQIIVPHTQFLLLIARSSM